MVEPIVNFRSFCYNDKSRRLYENYKNPFCVRGFRYKVFKSLLRLIRDK